MRREGMPRATGTAGHEGPGRSPTPEEIDNVVAQAESFTREAAESEQSPTQGELDGVVAEAEQITAEAAAEYSGVESGQESTEDAAEVQASETLRTDAEILGRHYPVKHMVKDLGNKRRQLVERTEAGWNNLKDSPGLLKDKFMHSLAQSSYDRRKAKLDEVAHLSDNNPLKKLRMRKLQKAEARLNKRKANLEIRQNRMTGRVEAVKNAYESRREAIVAELADRRTAALNRKAVRHELRQQGAGWLEARKAAKEHIDSIPKEQQKRIASALLHAVEANKSSREASQEARYAERASADAQNRVEMLGQELGQTRVDLENTHQQSAEIAGMEANLVTVKENVTKLREKAESLSDDSANKFAAMNELVQAENQQAEMEQTIANHRQRLAELQERERRLAQELIQARANAESAGKALEDRARAEAAAKKKAEAAKQARSQRVNETFV